MQNENIYDEVLNDSVAIRREINEVHWKRMNELSKEFQSITGLTHREFQLAKDMIYYQGGWPAKTTRPRFETIVKNFSLTCQVLHYLGRDQMLQDNFKKFGLEVKFTPIPSTASQKTQDVISEALSVQKQICQKADKIKLEAAPKISHTCKVQQTHFLNNVRIAAKKAKGAKIGRDHDNFVDETNSAIMVLEKLKKST